MQAQLSTAHTLRGVIGLALLLILIGGAAASAAPMSQGDTPTTPPQPLQGEASYLENCAPCHGATGQGDGSSASGLSVPPTALGKYDVIAARSFSELFEITKNGNMQRMMPPWADRLSDQEIWDTVAYAWSLHTSAQEIETGADIYAADCAICHGPDGKGVQAGVPDLTDFAATSAVSQATWAASVASGKGAMPGFAGKLNEADQRTALAYVRSLSLGGPLFRGPLAPGAGVISGTITNGTTNEPLAGATVELGIFDQASLLEQRTATTDAAGLYRFTELPTDSSLSFAARVEYPTGMPYGTDFASFEDGQTALDLSIAVYETTNDPTGLRAERVHFIVEFDPTTPGQALVAELMVFSLDGNRAYAGDAGGVLRFPLPAGAADLTINEAELGGRFQATADGFVDLLALPPGQNVRQILYRYTLPYTGGQLDFKRTLPYPATNVNVLIGDVGQQVTSSQLADQGKREAQGASYFTLLGQNLLAGQEIVISMTGLTATGAASTAGAAATAGATPINRGLIFILFGLAATGAAALVALPLLRGSMRGRNAPVVSLADAGPVDSDGLVDALAQLDLAHEAGELSDAAYRDRRLHLKAQLRDLLRKENQE